ncbi:50S ribosomal protein L24e [[Eubacterium] cellulosolvens]|nr:50S ribosomal protein L24e [Candidatus Bathyarchaeota archaeon]
MPRSFACSFCGKKYPPSSGTSYIRNDGSILYFCSTKCRKSQLELRRDPRKLKWTEHYTGKKK